MRGTVATGGDERCDAPGAGGQAPSGMTQAQKWTLDGSGNWAATSTAVDSATTNETRGVGPFNEYTTVGNPAVSQSYDANGNLVDDGAHVYKWDAFNRLREVWTAGGGSTKIVAYLYDATNRRVRKDMVSGTDINYYYDGWQIIQEHENGASTPARQFVYGSYIDEPLCVDINANADGSCIGTGDTRLFYHQNAIYSVCALTDTTGALVEAYEYDPYGKHWKLTPGTDGQWWTSDDVRAELAPSDLAYANPFLFTGREFDAESGLYCYRNRYYSTEQGRFISRDFDDIRLYYSGAQWYDSEPGIVSTPRPKEQPYTYAADSPIVLVDPNGLEPERADHWWDLFGYMSPSLWLEGLEEATLIGPSGRLGASVGRSSARAFARLSSFLKLGEEVSKNAQGQAEAGARPIGGVPPPDAMVQGIEEAGAECVKNGFETYGPSLAIGALGKSLSEVDKGVAAGIGTKIEGHHLLPKKFVDRFEAAGLKIDDYVLDMEQRAHRFKPGGLHTGAEHWNKQWETFFENTEDISPQKILDQLAKMKKDFGLE